MIADAIAGLLASFTNATIENPRYSLNDPALYEALAAGTKSESGIPVTHIGSLSLAPVYQAVSTISGDVAKYPLNAYKRLPSDDREIDMSHPAQFICSERWNDETPAFEGWRRLMTHAPLWSNGYAYISRTGGRYGVPVEMFNLLPDRTFPDRLPSGERCYWSEVDGKMELLYKEEVLHVKGLSIENGVGFDLVCAARDSWGLALAAQGYASKFFANGAQAAGILEVPAAMKETAVQNLEEGLRKRTGKDNWFKTMVLRDGAKFHSVTIDAEKSQMHELREDQVRDVARYFNLPPNKLGLSDSVSYNSEEQRHLGYLMSCLSHWLCAIVGECKLKLLTEQQQRSGSHYLEHNLSKGLEIDVKTMNEVLEIQRRNEIINANEWRRKINLNKRKDPGGEEYINPNTKSASDPTPEPNKPAKKPAKAHRVLIENEINRVARRVCFDAKAASKKPAKFMQWLDGGAVEHRVVFDESMRPVLNAWCSVMGGEPEPMLCTLSGRFFVTVLDSLMPLVEPPHSQDQLAANVETACASFESSISATLMESIQ